VIRKPPTFSLLLIAFVYLRTLIASLLESTVVWVPLEKELPFLLQLTKVNKRVEVA
jgi:hypothetical protein